MKKKLFSLSLLVVILNLRNCGIKTAKMTG